MEMAFAKLKAVLRAAEARTIPDPWQAIADAFAASPRKNAPTISPQDTMQREQKMLWWRTDRASRRDAA
jgi:hypothetical protein